MNAISAFSVFLSHALVPAKAARYSGLAGTPKGQRKLLDSLNHDFDRAIRPNARRGSVDRRVPCYAYHSSVGFGAEFSAVAEACDHLWGSDPRFAYTTWMIATLKKDGQYGPVIVCDHCGRVIDDAMNANALSSAAPEGTTAQTFHVHKGDCDQALSAKFGSSLGSEELSVHLFDLMRNTLRNSDLERVRNLLQWTAG